MVNSSSSSSDDSNSSTDDSNSASADSKPPTTPLSPHQKEVIALRRELCLQSEQIDQIFGELATVRNDLLHKQAQLYRANRLICQLSSRTTPRYSTARKCRWVSTIYE